MPKLNYSDYQTQVEILWKKGLECKEIGKIIGLHPVTISKIAKSINIKFLRGNRNRRKYEINENIFEKIDTEQKAYFLGLLMADGSLTIPNNRCYTIKLGLVSSDSYLLEKFRDLVFPKLKPKIYLQSPSKNSLAKQDFSTISIHSNKIGNDLKKYGFIRNKSLVLKIPDLKLIPSSLMRHFVRGFFDGDGSFFIREEFAGFSFISSYGFSNQLSDILNNNNITNSIYIHSKECKNNYIVRSTSLDSLLNFLLFIYEDCSVFLDRKKESILDFLKTKILIINNRKIETFYNGKGIVQTKNNKWLCRCSLDNKRKYLGIFDNKEEAIAEYNKYAQQRTMNRFDSSLIKKINIVMKKLC